MITFSGILGLGVGDEVATVDDADGVATVDVAAVAEATASDTDLAGISDGKLICRLWDSDVIVPTGLIGVWLTAVTLVTVWTAGSA